MLRKTTAAVVLAGALALGTASATSLGTFDDITFAASNADLLDCTLDSDAISLVPELPSVDTVTTDPLVSTATALLGTIDVDLSSLPAACIDDEFFDLVIIGDSDVLGVIEGVDPTAAASDVLSLDASSLLGTVPDVSAIQEVRMVLSETAPTP